MKTQFFAALTLAGLLATAPTTAEAIDLIQQWKVNAGKPPVADNILLPTGDGTRGLAYNPATNHLLVPTRFSGGFAIYILNADTGIPVYESDNVTPKKLNTTGIVNGTFVINKIVVGEDNKIYVANVQIASSSSKLLKVYRYDSEDSAPTTIISLDNMPYRTGDGFDVKGSGVNTKILLSGSNTGGAIAYFTTTDGSTFTKTDIVPSNPPLPSGAFYAKFDPWENAYWTRSTGSGNEHSVKYDLSTNQSIRTAGMTNLPDTSISKAAYGPFGVGTINNKKVIIEAIGNSSQGTPGKPVYAFDLDLNPAEPVYRILGTEYTGGPIPEIPAYTVGSLANGNGTGEVVFDSTNDRVFILYTNNAITSYKYIEPTASVNDWSVY